MTTTPGSPDGPAADDPADGSVATTAQDPGEDYSADRRFFGHPLALANLFSVELWERFSFYGMQAVMTLYLYYTTEGGLGLDKGAATSIIGAYGGMVYLACVAGAWVADRVLGAERTLFYSACVVMLGHIALAVLPGLGGVAVGLVLVALGSGGVKTSATAVVGSLYRRDDPRADAGFSIFYMGINIGALVGPLLTGATRAGLGSFHLAFGLAAVGMALGLGIYVSGRKNLPPSASAVPNPLTPGAWVRPAVGVVIAAVVVVLLFVLGVLTPDNLSTAVAIVVAVIAIALFTLLLTNRRVTVEERSRVRSFIPMWLGSVVFWSLFQQQFSVVEIYADERLNRVLGGWEMPTEFVNSLEPFFVIVLAPLFALMWTKLGDRAPSTPVKFALGAGGMGVAFLLFLPWAGGTGNSTPVLAIVLIMFVFALAELNLSPVGLSLSTRIGPRLFRSQTVALFYLSISLGSALAGTLAGFYDPSVEGTYFATLGIVALVLGGVLFALSPWIRRAMRGVR